MDYEFSEKLQPFIPEFQKTETEFIGIYSIEGGKAKWWQSKVGGYPYLPIGAEYPKATNGKHLLFLAQINCAELPENDWMPKQGLLQFFIYDDGNFGYRAKNPEQQDFFRIIYYPSIVEDLQAIQNEFSFLRKMNNNPTKGGGKSWPIEFELESEFCPSGDYHFEKYLGADFFEKFGEEKWNIRFEYDETVSAAGHKIGGFAEFAGDDPRSMEDPMLLLLQLDSDDEMIDWGDFGLLNFFIRKADIEKLDFSKVRMHWDNGD